MAFPYHTIQFRRGTAAAWTLADPMLAAGELGYETDTGKFKLGDGTTAWSSLDYAIDAFVGDLTGTANQVTVANGTGAVIGAGTQLSLPQDIDTAANVEFESLILTAAADTATVLDIDGDIDYTGSGTALGIDLSRDYNVGAGNVNNCCGISNYMRPKHTAAIMAATKFAYAIINRLLGEGTLIHNTAALRYFYQYGDYAWVDDRNAYDTSSTGQLLVSSSAVKAINDCTAIFTDSGGTTPATQVRCIGVEVDVTCSPTLGSGALSPLSIGIDIDVTGTATGSSIAYGIYISDVSGCDYNISIMDTVDAPWIKSPGTGATGVVTGGAQMYVMDRGGVAAKASWYIKNEDDATDYYVGPLYGEMYDYENAVAVAIDETNVYHAISTIDTAGLCKGWTFKAGSTGPIASFATYAAGAATLITDVGHGLLDGEIITIANSTNYNGAHVVTRIDADTFTIPVAYVLEAGGPNWIRGSSLLANAGSAGVYRITWGATVTGAGANENMKVEPVLNTTDLDNMATSRKLGGAGDRGAMGGSGLVTIADGDYLWFQTRNESSVADLTFRHFNASITKL